MANKTTILQSLPNLLNVSEEKKILISGNQKLSLRYVDYKDEFEVSSNNIIKVLPLKNNHQETTIQFVTEQQIKEEKPMLRRVHSCPNMESFENGGNEGNSNNFPKMYSKVMKVSRAISSFIVIPTFLILANNLVTIHCITWWMFPKIRLI